MAQFYIDPPEQFQYWHYEATLGAALLINARSGAKYLVRKHRDGRFKNMWVAMRIRGI